MNKYHSKMLHVFLMLDASSFPVLRFESFLKTSIQTVNLQGALLRKQQQAEVGYVTLDVNSETILKVWNSVKNEKQLGAGLGTMKTAMTDI